MGILSAWRFVSAFFCSSRTAQINVWCPRLPIRCNLTQPSLTSLSQAWYTTLNNWRPCHACPGGVSGTSQPVEVAELCRLNNPGNHRSDGCFGPRAGRHLVARLRTGRAPVASQNQTAARHPDPQPACPASHFDSLKTAPATPAGSAWRWRFCGRSHGPCSHCHRHLWARRAIDLGRGQLLAGRLSIRLHPDPTSAGRCPDTRYWSTESTIPRETTIARRTFSVAPVPFSISLPAARLVGATKWQPDLRFWRPAPPSCHGRRSQL